MWKKALTAAATCVIAVTLPVQAGCTAQGDEGGGRKLVVVECQRCDEADDGTPAGCKSIAADTSGQVTSSGLSLGSKDGGWRAGAVLEHGAVAGGAGAGAFDDGSRHMLTFANYAKRMRLGDAADAGKGWSVAVSTRLAGGLMRSDGILQEAKGLYSQHHVALAHAGDRHRTQLRIEQPLRAESGRANFKRPVGRTVAGRWIYDTARIGLHPEARAVRIGAQHERELGTGKIAFGASYTDDAGHRPGEDDAAIGARYELRW